MCDEADELLQAAVLSEEQEEALVLSFALLQHIVFIQQLDQRHVLLFQQLLHLRRCVEIKLPEHDDGSAPGLNTERTLKAIRGMESEQSGNNSSIGISPNYSDRREKKTHHSN